MTQYKTSCLAAVFVTFCVTFMPGGTIGCTGEAMCTFCVKYWIVMIVVVLQLVIQYVYRACSDEVIGAGLSWLDHF